MFNKVDLPDPDLPMIKTSPLSGSVKLMSFNATTTDLFLLLNTLVNFLISIILSPIRL